MLFAFWGECIEAIFCLPLNLTFCYFLEEED